VLENLSKRAGEHCTTKPSGNGFQFRKHIFPKPIFVTLHTSHSFWWSLIPDSCKYTADLTYEGVTKSFCTGRLERELRMVQLSATTCSCVAILWVSLVSFTAITLCVASQQVFISLWLSPETFGYILVDSNYLSLCFIKYSPYPNMLTYRCYRSKLCLYFVLCIKVLNYEPYFQKINKIDSIFM
jgi:hypothetical protein